MKTFVKEIALKTLKASYTFGEIVSTTSLNLASKVDKESTSDEIELNFKTSSLGLRSRLGILSETETEALSPKVEIFQALIINK